MTTLSNCTCKELWVLEVHLCHVALAKAIEFKECMASKAQRPDSVIALQVLADASANALERIRCMELWTDECPATEAKACKLVARLNELEYAVLKVWGSAEVEAEVESKIPMKRHLTSFFRKCEVCDCAGIFRAPDYATALTFARSKCPAYRPGRCLVAVVSSLEDETDKQARQAQRDRGKGKP